MKKKLMLILMVVTLALVTIVSTVYAASKSYHGITVIYNNSISDSGNSGWNAGRSESTSPSTSMNQLGISFWSAYCKCDGSIDYSTYSSHSNQYSYNVTSASDGMAKSKPSGCGSQQLLLGVNYAQHYWQDGGYSGDGGTITYSRPLTPIQ